VEYQSAVIEYPGCLVDDTIKLMGSQLSWPKGSLLGVGEFLTADEAKKYGFPQPDREAVPVGADLMPLGFGAKLTWNQSSNATVDLLLATAVKGWAKLLQQGAKAS
jgi:hypothetical protein